MLVPYLPNKFNKGLTLTKIDQSELKLYLTFNCITIQKLYAVFHWDILSSVEDKCSKSCKDLIKACTQKILLFPLLKKVVHISLHMPESWYVSLPNMQPI